MGVYTQTEQNTVLVLRHPKGAVPVNPNAHRGTVDLAELAQWLEGVAAGLHSGDVGVDVHRGSTSARPQHASALLTASTASGAVGATINGVAVTATAAGGDAASMTLVAAAINASSNALVQGLVGASNLAATITLSSTAAGSYVEIKDTAGGLVRFTAVSGKPAGRGEFNIDGTDTADAAALVSAINAHPAFMDKLVATSSSGVVTLRQLVQSTTSKYRLEASGMTLSGSSLAATAVVIVWALQKGVVGNTQTFAATGTGMTASAARLSGGVGGDATAPVRFVR